MTKEEKQLLLVDLCGRLPYGVICTDNRHGDSRVFNVDAEDERVYYTDFDEWGLIENCKPYLRPMSSMTEEERRLYTSFRAHAAPFAIVRWLDQNHFDHRTDMEGETLISLGLALEAPEGMYNW